MIESIDPVEYRCKSHDWWIGLVLSTIGAKIFIECAYSRNYIQHSHEDLVISVFHLDSVRLVPKHFTIESIKANKSNKVRHEYQNEKPKNIFCTQIKNNYAD